MFGKIIATITAIIILLESLYILKHLDFMSRGEEYMKPIIAIICYMAIAISLTIFYILIK